MRQLQAARLTRLVSLQRRAAGQGPRGQALEQWDTVEASIWAGVEPLRGRDYFAAGQMQSPADVLVIMHWRAGVEPGMRIVDGDDVYEIVTPVDVGGRRITLELMCVAGVRGAR